MLLFFMFLFFSHNFFYFLKTTKTSNHLKLKKTNLKLTLTNLKQVKLVNFSSFNINCKIYAFKVACGHLEDAKSADFV